jgi:uncharacterized NAD-dependent epimerase/dehydratase family protein
VALGILHGSLPDVMILCHRTDIGVSDYGINTDDLEKMITLNENLVSFIKPSKVIGIALNSYNLTQDKVLHLIDNIENSTGLPTTDPVRFGAEKLTDAIIGYFKKYRKKH